MGLFPLYYAPVTPAPARGPKSGLLLPGLLGQGARRAGPDDAGVVKEAASAGSRLMQSNRRRAGVCIRANAMASFVCLVVVRAG